VKRQRLAPEIAEAQARPMSLEDYARRTAAPIEDADVADTMDLVQWFCRRYPTARERFAYVNRKYAEWTRREPWPPR
jgi:hypothetical protein